MAGLHSWLVPLVFLTVRQGPTHGGLSEGPQTPRPRFIWGGAGVTSDSGMFLGRPTRTLSAVGLTITASACRSSRYSQVRLGLRYTGSDSVRFVPDSTQLVAMSAKPKTLKYIATKDVSRHLMGDGRIAFSASGADELDARAAARERFERDIQPHVDSVNRVLKAQISSAVLGPQATGLVGEVFFSLGPKDAPLQLTLGVAMGQFVIPLPPLDDC